MVTGSPYEYLSPSWVALVPLILVTVTSTTLPTAPAVAVAVIWLSETTVKPVAGALPNKTPVAPVNWAPVMVTAVPPAVTPNSGETLLTEGGGL